MHAHDRETCVLRTPVRAPRERPSGAHDPSRRRWLARATAAAACAAAWPLHAEEPSALERIRARRSLVVGVYRDMPPFHAGGQGIDVEVARALAAQLGVGL